MNSATRPGVSVIIQFLNAAKYLEESIRSVYWQTYTDWELILVDGGSTDDSEAIAARHVAARPGRVRLLRHTGERTLGIFSSRAWGGREARAQLLAHLDSDDEWHPQFLEQHLALHRRFLPDREGLVYGPMVYWTDDPAATLESYVQPVPPTGVHEAPALVTHFIADNYSQTPCNSAVTMNRSVLAAAASLVGTADEGMVEDQFLWSYIALHYPICVAPEPLGRYRQWPGSTCARTLSAGRSGGLREAHLAWLQSFIPVECRDTPETRALFAEVSRVRASAR